MGLEIEHSGAGKVVVVWLAQPIIVAEERLEFVTFLNRAATDAKIATVVLAGKKNAFNGPHSGQIAEDLPGPSLSDLTNALAKFPKPLVAALADTVAGTGLEIAVACHYRIAARTCQFAFAETSSGYIPGAGGTVRLAWLLGLNAAATLIASGRPITAPKALDLGLVDGVATDDVLAMAIQWATDRGEPIAAPLPLAESPTIDRAVFDALESRVAKQTRGAEAPRALLELLRRISTVPFKSALEEEGRCFHLLQQGDQAKALKYIRTSERAAAELPADIAGATSAEVRLVGVIGAGTMGAGIATSFADAGYAVRLVEKSSNAMTAGIDRIYANFTEAKARGLIDETRLRDRINRIEGTHDYERLAECDLIIEAVFESMEVKKELFKLVDQVARPGAILATNTSYLDVNEIAAVTSRPEAVIGMHYFSPAHVMKLLEIVRGTRTGATALATALAVAKTTAKVPVISGVCSGFIGNRMLRAYAREAGLLLLEGATPQQIDHSLTEFGMAMGPFAVADLAGLDIGYMARRQMPPGSFEPLAVTVHDRLVEAGFLGRKSGAGFYRYNRETGAVLPNVIVADFIREAQSVAGRTSRSVAAMEIVSRTILALINEGYWILQEMIAQRAGDIDVVYVNGYGFPRYRGGPLYYAKHDLGLDRVISRIEEYRNGDFGQYWTPSPLLQREARKS